MKKNVEKKKKVVDNISQILNDFNIISLVGYKGIKSLDIKVLRQVLSKENLFIKVVKNSLAKRIFKNIGYDVLTEDVYGQFFVIAGKDVFSTILVLEKIKTSNENFAIFKTAIGNFLVTNSLMKELLKFGSNFNVLLKLITVLQTPLFNFVNLLKLPVYNFTNLMKILEKKGGYNNVN